MALSYGPARGLAYDRRRGFRAWVDRDDRHGRNFCLVRCNAHKRVQALPTIPRHGVNTVDAPLQERVKSRKNRVVFISVIENPPKVDILLSRATHVNVWLQSRSLPARGRVGLEVHRCLCIIDAGNVFISTVMG